MAAFPAVLSKNRSVDSGLICELLEKLYRIGVRDVVLAPGSRNAPIIAAIEASGVFNLYFWGEERSGSFFALGKIKGSKRPTAIVTTSGTAVAELFAAAMEAYYTDMPLILVTADRPRRFRGTNAPQAAEQKGIFGIYTKIALDIAPGEAWDIESWNQKSPLHLNICLEEPKSPLFVEAAWNFEEGIAKKAVEYKQEDIFYFQEFIYKVKSPLILVGTLEEEEREGVQTFLRSMKVPVWLEAISGLREDAGLASFTLQKEGSLLKGLEGHGYPVDSVISIGGVPTLRFWRDLESLNLPIITISKTIFPGTTKILRHIRAEPAAFLKNIRAGRYLDPGHYFEKEREFAALLENLFMQNRTSEPELIHQLSLMIPENAQIFLGNSLPIREWDFFATRKKRHPHIFASRGLNGIEGQLSTFLGLAKRSVENWAILGDQTLLYDLAGFAICDKMKDFRLRIAVINNGGGKIFERMFSHPSLENRHQHCFVSLAEFWGLDYACFRAIPECADFGQHTFIEIVPSEDKTRLFWEGYKALCGRV